MTFFSLFGIYNLEKLNVDGNTLVSLIFILAS